MNDELVEKFKEYQFTDEVIIELLNYCNKKCALDKKYILVVAESWYKHNITTMKALDNYCRQCERLEQIGTKISRILKRPVTAYEEAYIEKWTYQDMIDEQQLIELVQKYDEFDEIDKIIPNLSEKIKMKTGFNELDEIIDLEENNLIVVGDRTAIGKTTFVSNIALNIAKQNIPVLFFSFNKSKEKILSEMTLSETVINIEDLVIGKVTQENLDNLKKTYSKIQELPLYIENEHCIDNVFFRIKEKCKKLVTEKNIKLVIIDDLQYLEDRNCKGYYIKDLDLSDTCYGIKELSKELNIPILVTSQLSSGLDYRPKLKELKYPSSIVKYADTIILLHREDLYNPNSEKRNIAEINVVKNKNGKLGLVELFYMDNYKKFANMARNI